ncbi:hypothetical protein E2C01_037147 [Portunus trituberculatus]|uniref:Uncharacterized protein n=1 Tax=Portunus trituberculatus TaxID=210409 RepID=A0A5B7FEK2_PORTR|nr:hypothetical protein [Portunus trituberculatus]
MSPCGGRRFGCANKIDTEVSASCDTWQGFQGKRPGTLNLVTVDIVLLRPLPPPPFTWSRRGGGVPGARCIPEVRRGEGGGDVVRVMRGNTARLMLSTSGRLAGPRQMAHPL